MAGLFLLKKSTSYFSIPKQKSVTLINLIGEMIIWVGWAFDLWMICGDEIDRQVENG